MLAAIFSSQKCPRRAANTISRYIPEIRWALSAAVPSASCLLSSYREIMTSSPRTAIANSGSFIIWEQKDLILSMLLCLGGGICRVLQSGSCFLKLLFVGERLSSKESCRCFPANLPYPPPPPRLCTRKKCLCSHVGHRRPPIYRGCAHNARDRRGPLWPFAPCDLSTTVDDFSIVFVQ